MPKSETRMPGERRGCRRTRPRSQGRGGDGQGRDPDLKGEEGMPKDETPIPRERRGWRRTRPGSHGSGEGRGGRDPVPTAETRGAEGEERAAEGETRLPSPRRGRWKARLRRWGPEHREAVARASALARARSRRRRSRSQRRQRRSAPVQFPGHLLELLQRRPQVVRDLLREHVGLGQVGRVLQALVA